MEKAIQSLQQAAKTHRDAILSHDVYQKVKSLDDLRVFMEHHVYAVWDFMSLLKALQQELTCVTTPWYPKYSGELRYLINEIVIGEESDTAFNGEKMSHYEMYLSAMKQCGANTDGINRFVKQVQAGKSVKEAFEHISAPKAVVDFVTFTMSVIEANKPHVVAAVFTFGREDLIPDMFLRITQDISKDHPNEMQEFVYYLERHIELDGDHHGELALKMTAALCGEDSEKWREASEAVQQCLQQRKNLWDGVVEQINRSSVK